MLDAKNIENEKFAVMGKCISGRRKRDKTKRDKIDAWERHTDHGKDCGKGSSKLTSTGTRDRSLSRRSARTFSENSYKLPAELTLGKKQTTSLKSNAAFVTRKEPLSRSSKKVKNKQTTGTGPSLLENTESRPDPPHKGWQFKLDSRKIRLIRKNGTACGMFPPARVGGGGNEALTRGQPKDKKNYGVKSRPQQGTPTQL